MHPFAFESKFEVPQESTYLRPQPIRSINTTRTYQKCLSQLLNYLGVMQKFGVNTGERQVLNRGALAGELVTLDG